MRYCIFSDVHSNLEAFESVLSSAKNDRIDRYICGGDIVGYGADASTCIRITSELADAVVCGNHDRASVGLLGLSYFNEYARDAVSWTAKALTKHEADYLKRLEFVYEDADFAVVHGSLYEPERFHYIVDAQSSLPTFYVMEKHLCFVGHSHRPAIFAKSDSGAMQADADKVTLQPGASYVINSGSVGQPRDGDPAACYVVYDSKARSVEIKRAAYDIRKAQDKIIKARLPRFLAERLSAGR